MSDDMPDRDAVVGLLLKHRNGLHAFVLATVRDPHLAEDVLQDVSVAICSSWKSYDQTQPFLGWARRIARNRMFDTFRKQQRSREILDPEIVERAMAKVDTQVDAEAWSVRLEQCLKKLGKKARAVLHRRYANKEKPGRIAQALGMTANSAYVLLSRAKRQLLVCLHRREAVS